MAKLVYEGREHAFDLSCLVRESPVVLGIEVAEVACEEQVVVEFTGRAHRDEHESGKLRVAAPAAMLAGIEAEQRRSWAVDP